MRRTGFFGDFSDGRRQIKSLKTHTSAGRKSFKRALKEDNFSLQVGQSVMQVVSLRGSNVIEVMDGKAVKSLALVPAKFHKSFWIKRGSLVVVDEGGREKALESGSKIACIVSQVLFHDQVRALRKSSDWPAAFEATMPEEHAEQPRSRCEEETNSDGEVDGLPPLEANPNRRNPMSLASHSGSDDSE